MATPDFDKLNSQIKEAGADWVAGETSLSKYFGTRTASKHMGLALSQDSAFASLQRTREADQQLMFGAPAALPNALDWRNHNGKNWVTPIRDQKTCGSCVAFATIASVESRLLIAENKPGVDLDLSEGHLFSCGAPNHCELGWQPVKALEFVKTTGLGYERAFPYKPNNQTCKVIPIAVKSTGRNSAGTSLARKKALQEGPVIACIKVFDDFLAYRSGIYSHIRGGMVGLHAICVVGYDDGKGCWIAKNSWGTGWGNRGFFQIRYGECGIDTQFSFDYPQQLSLQVGATIP